MRPGELFAAFRSPAGALGRLVVAEEPGFLEAVRSEMSNAALRGEAGHRRAVLLGGPAHLVFGPLRGAPRLRHGARHLLFRTRVPRLQEFASLAWLRRNGFAAPRPLVAGAWFHGALPHFQFLATEHLAEPSLAELAGAEDDPRRASGLRQLGTELARLHARGFVHGELSPTKVLVAERPKGPVVVFLGGRGGGPPGWPRPGAAALDLARFFAEGARVFPREEQALVVRAYAAERSSMGSAVGERFWRAVERRRARITGAARDSWEVPR